MYLAMLGDLVGSRRIEGRQAVAARLEEALSTVAGSYRDHWLAPLTPTKGLDEISGVLVKAEHAFDIAIAVNEAIWPHRFRFALASGGIDVAVDSGDAAKMDGEVFHRAAETIQRAKQQRLALGLHLQQVDDAVCGLIEQLAQLRQCLVNDWTPTRASIVQQYRTGATQADIAAMRGVTQQTVNAHLKTARWHEIAASENAIRLYFASMHLG